MAADLKAQLQEKIKNTHVLVFSKTTCPFCDRIKRLFQVQCVSPTVVELNKEDNGADIQQALGEISGQKTVPNVFINGKHVGGCTDTISAHSNGSLARMIMDGEQARDPTVPSGTYEYDLLVIGGGSGGLSCAKAAGAYGGKVCCMDFVTPSPQGTKWGLGGTCVNVGCIPKKLMHQAALLGQAKDDAEKFGWEFSSEVSHKWSTMVEGIQNHIGSLNWGYRSALGDKGVKYINGRASFIDPHTIKYVNKRGLENMTTAARVVIATGGRPRYPDIPGAKEYGITSDDLFSLTTPPGKTLVVGASYVALECAGFLAGLGFEVTCMVRSILLRGFDQQMADKAGDYMLEHKVKFIRQAVPVKVEQIEKGPPSKLKVEFKYLEDEKIASEEFNTVLFAIGRTPDVAELGLDKAGVHFEPKTLKIPTVYEQTNVPHIYAIGDVQENKLELTPMAIQSGKLLAQRMFGDSRENADYINVATTVFTPLEYGCIGLAEEDALKIYGESNIEVYHMHFQPLEFTVAGRSDNQCYIKVVCNKSDKERVVGLHVLSPNAGEITQGYALAMKLGATKADFDGTIGIHPTCSENFTTLTITKNSGVDSKTTGC